MLQYNPVRFCRMPRRHWGPALSETSRPIDRLSIALLCVVIFLFWAALYIYVPVLPVHAKDAGASMFMVGLIGGIYGFSQLIARIPLGVMSDQVGARKPFVAAGLALGILGGIGFVVGRDPALILLSRGLHGLTAAAWVNMSVLFASYFPSQRATYAMGIISFINAVSMLLATYSGGLIASNIGRIETFWVSTGVSALALICLLFTAEERGIQKRGISWAELLSVGRVPALMGISAIAVLAHFIVYAVPFTFVPIYAAKVLAATDADLGLLTTALLAPYTAATLISPFLASRLGDRLSMFLGMMAMAVSLLSIPLTHDLGTLAMVQGITGFGRGLIYPIMMATTIKSVPKHQRATAMGIFQAVYAIGMFLGPASAGVVAESFGLTNAFLFNGTVGLVAGALILRWIPGKVRQAAVVEQAG